MPPKGYVLSEETKEKLRKFHLSLTEEQKIERSRKISESRKGKYSGENHPGWGTKRTEESKQKMSNAKIGVFNGSKNPNWKGGVISKNLAAYGTYFEKLSPYHNVRRNPNDKYILQVECIYCGKWHSPSLGIVNTRVDFIYGSGIREGRFYCSDSCKKNCPTFRKRKNPESLKIGSSREVQAELRKMCFERDGFTCQRCGTVYDLHCHHIEGIQKNPIESADLDNVITVCSSCHKYIHKQAGCTYNSMKCK